MNTPRYPYFCLSVLFNGQFTLRVETVHTILPYTRANSLCFPKITVLINFTWQEKNKHQEINSDRVKEWTTHSTGSFEKVQKTNLDDNLLRLWRVVKS